MPRSFALVILSWLTLAGAVAWGQQRRTSPIPVREIRPGMKGHGLTVFRGTQPERFAVEVIDVLHNFRPDMDLILVRTKHPVLERATTVAGMSGSPIFLEGRLAGAYAYGWPFGKDPVAGVTPIKNMFTEMRRPVRPDSFPGADRIGKPLRTRTQARSRPGRTLGLGRWDGRGPRTAFTTLRSYASRVADAAPSGTGRPGLVPTATPLMLGGFTDTAADILGEQLKPFGLVALQAGGASSPGRKPATPPRFVPGGAIGVQLIRGDISATGVGTVTHVGAHRLVAFGHPMMNAGEVGLPTATARVLHILASQSRSFKIAEARQPLGTLIHDRQSAIVVDPSLQSSTVPVRIRIHGVQGAPRTEWNVEVASHRVLTPVLTFAALANAVGATASDQTDVMFAVRSRVDIDGHGFAEVEDVGHMAAGPNDMQSLSRLRCFDLIDAAYGNPFVRSRVRRVELDVTLDFSRDVYQIVDASVAGREVDPGATVPVRLILRRFGEQEQSKVVRVRIPPNAAGETVEIRLEAGNDVRLEQPVPQNLGDMVAAIRNQYTARELTVSVKLPSRGLRLEGHVVRDLPASALDALSFVNDTRRGQPFVTQSRRLVEIDGVLIGSAALKLDVRKHPQN